MRPNGGVYASVDSGSIEGGLGLDEECAECVILVANRALLTIELMVVRSGGGINQDRRGGRR